MTTDPLQAEIAHIVAEEVAAFEAIDGPLLASPAKLEENYQTWLTTLLPAHFRGMDQFAGHHDEFWAWGWPIAAGEPAEPPAYLAIWPRGGAKSTTAEGFAVACGARKRRKFGLYVCRTQDQADSHIAAISSMILKSHIGRAYPQMANPKVSQVGTRMKQDAWNRSVLTTASGFTMQGYGLQSAFRGIRVEEYRPDLIIISDVDDVGDTPTFVNRLLAHLAGSVLGTASNDCVILFEQNLIHHNSMMNQILRRETDVLSHRYEGGPVPAVYDLEIERVDERWYIVAPPSEPSWVGQDLIACEQKLNTFGREWFERECQHEVDRVLGRQRFIDAYIKRYTPRRPTLGEVFIQRDGFGNESVQFYPSPTGTLAIWTRPDPNRTYAAGADTAEGDDAGAGVSSSSDPDYSVAHIRDAHTGEQVARLRGRMSEGAFGEILYALLRWFNSPFLVPEVKGGFGRATVNKLRELGYEPELIFNRHMMAELEGLPPYQGQVGYRDFGWHTGAHNRPTLIQFLDDAINARTIETYDGITIEEYKHFCYNADGKPEAEPGYHDDCVLADALCCVAIRFALKLEPLRKRKGQRQTALPQSYGQNQQLTDEQKARLKREARMRNSMR